MSSDYDNYIKFLWIGKEREFQLIFFPCKFKTVIYNKHFYSNIQFDNNTAKLLLYRTWIGTFGLSLDFKNLLLNLKRRIFSSASRRFFVKYRLTKKLLLFKKIKFLKHCNFFVRRYFIKRLWDTLENIILFKFDKKCSKL